MEYEIELYYLPVHAIYDTYTFCSATISDLDMESLHGVAHEELQFEDGKYIKIDKSVVNEHLIHNLTEQIWLDDPDLWYRDDMLFYILIPAELYKGKDDF